MVRKTYEKFIAELKRQPMLFVSVWVAQFSIIALVLMSAGVAPSLLLADGDEENIELVAGTAEVAEGSPTIVDKGSFNEVVESVSTEESAPVRIIVDAIGIDTSVKNPKSTDINILDQELTKGAVHYPGSGNLDDISNMFLFGHSSSLPNVRNQSYKAFNKLGELKKGDLIRVQSATKEYHYRVLEVDEVKAEDAWVEFETGKKQLTLSTCNNFGSKQDRFVVTADYIGSFVLDA